MLVKKFTVVILVFALFFLCFYFFSAQPKVQTIKVQLVEEDQVLTCQSAFNANGDNNAWSVEQFQLFLSNIEVTSDQSKWQRLPLAKSAYQNASTVLLGTNCRQQKQQNSAKEYGHWSIDFNDEIDMSKITAMRFTLGVPFELNHLNPVKQDSPLNLPSMFWVWQTGHKFLRVELTSESDKWLYHLGSTGCKAPSVMRAPASPCRYPNTVDFEVPIAQGNEGLLTMNINLSELLKGVEITQDTSCQSEQTNDSCQQLFKNLSLASEDTELTTKQRVFSIIKQANMTKGVAVE